MTDLSSILSAIAVGTVGGLLLGSTLGWLFNRLTRP